LTTIDTFVEAENGSFEVNYG